MRVSRRCLFCIVVTLTIVAGCTDPKKPSDSTFRAAIDDAFKGPANPACIFGLEGARNELRLKRWIRYPVTSGACDTLKTVGVVTGGGGLGASCMLVDQKLVQIAESDGTRYLCFASAAVDKIVRWTEPADLLGERLVEVTYTYRLSNIGDWAKNNNVIEKIPEIKELLQGDAKSEKKIVMKLFNDGWRVQAPF